MQSGGSGRAADVARGGNALWLEVPERRLPEPDPGGRLLRKQLHTANRQEKSFRKTKTPHILSLASLAYQINALVNSAPIAS